MPPKCWHTSHAFCSESRHSLWEVKEQRNHTILFIMTSTRRKIPPKSIVSIIEKRSQCHLSPPPLPFVLILSSHPNQFVLLLSGGADKSHGYIFFFESISHSFCDFRNVRRPSSNAIPSAYVFGRTGSTVVSSSDEKMYENELDRNLDAFFGSMTSISTVITKDLEVWSTYTTREVALIMLPTFTGRMKDTRLDSTNRGGDRK